MAGYGWIRAGFLIIVVCVVSAGCFHSLPHSSRPPPVVKEHELKNEQYRQWESIRSGWFKNEYQNCLKRSGLRTSCSGCVYIYITVVLDIDEKGRLSGYRKTGENVCSGEAPPELEACLVEYFGHLVFPESLRNMRLEVFLGTGLKC